ncbi:unnamed protein product [Tenebrio molitor]|nr:unnamed protein product [Tenebrio molitor]
MAPVRTIMKTRRFSKQTFARLKAANQTTFLFSLWNISRVERLD